MFLVPVLLQTRDMEMAKTRVFYPTVPQARHFRSDFGCSRIEDGYPGGPLSILGQLKALIRRLSPDFKTEP